jgi:hypothetical protein
MGDVPSGSARPGSAGDVKRGPAAPPLELTILMPCLNEAETLAACIGKASNFLERSGIQGEILIADNGSTDGSIEIARKHGARVIEVSRRGYGAALLAGIEEARGVCVIMGDADGSYDFSRLDDFVARLHEGYDLVIGDRFAGGIAPGAMPPIHRYFGNPVLSFLGRLFFPPGVKDFHCGLRGFRRDAALALGLRMPGMEFASELVVRSLLARQRIAEVPTTLSPDGRSRPPHLRTWRDGWRHLRFLLLFSPRWLFLYPGIAILAFGVALTALLLPGPINVAPHVTLDIHTFIVGCFALLVGTQCISFAFISRRYAASRGFVPLPAGDRSQFHYSLENVLIGAGLVMLIGLGGVAYCVLSWASLGFGPIAYPALVRILLISTTLVALAIQVALTAFLSALFEIDG